MHPSALIHEIESFIRHHPLNRLPDSDSPCVETPLVGFAAANDPLFTEYKQVIGAFHLTPQECVASVGATWQAQTVMSWILPASKAVRLANRAATEYPAQYWAYMRNYGEEMNGALRQHVVAFLQQHGAQALAPQRLAAWKQYNDTPVGIASSWSERHAAHAAGLGTFSINDALITAKGIAHRCGSVVTDLPFPISPRPYQTHTEYCLYATQGTCLACAQRCPVAAIGPHGHDKVKCSQYVYGTVPAAVAEKYQVAQTGCGLCQTKVPCEAQVPKPVQGKG
ncbi:hypothetical protein [Chrysiogenes arsenatis]|uniref:hypothetical protein n=1 Tax=Chrysiogenes arsenatis TaxID=309797 RepID=UPI00041E3557|nr:hypothetical protein [Chrysiogenes arsenatis]